MGGGWESLGGCQGSLKMEGAVAVSVLWLCCVGEGRKEEEG